MAQIRIAKKPHLVRDAFIAAVALSSLASPVSAQTYHEFYGPPTPLIFDAEGARHWCLYLYYGPFTPPMTTKDSNIISCQRGSTYALTVTADRAAHKTGRIRSADAIAGGRAHRMDRNHKLLAGSSNLAR